MAKRRLFVELVFDLPQKKINKIVKEGKIVGDIDTPVGIEIAGVRGKYYKASIRTE